MLLRDAFLVLDQLFVLGSDVPNTFCGFLLDVSLGSVAWYVRPGTPVVAATARLPSPFLAPS